MARYTGPKIRQSRKFGEAFTKKAEKYLAKRNYRPGQHGQNPQRISEFGMQLREKQKAKIIYGLMERQFRRYYEVASRKVGATGDALMQLLETRLDNVVFRLGIGATRAQARQLVSHGFFDVNGQKVNIPSYQLKVGDEIKVRESKKNSKYIKILQPSLNNTKTVEWLLLDPKNLSGKLLSKPTREQIDSNLNTQLIVEYYSR
ncbi:MAG: 30S ribosomal protein S4 [Candidatus Doudnabacteria bacterium RIFCSPLOWO2_01_FULL_44_21]|uniref:Small ribosomal subunit protein uS4 n=1 Tax=Candidatus Doudnabacteria bacterium RIFCSPLOWO2_01_FULL_44_21 TaxID=1817841 RepID=A0A1F5PXP4_9BACT|nr:MAG: 30S ribosomal protein S4 [Candidatus Doudnabacteria bacterium RIFCSPHIGHO2_02_FULL_43_13b]OGE94679.1 MAG: 30S ribosomal protein S4 [Candidatus Doudnabacteria bacterium RIFCSPLOWO2_01_FULL_44_21]